MNFITSKFKNSYFIPFHWNLEAGIEEVIELFKQIQEEQIHISPSAKNFTQEVIKARTQIVEWVIFVCKNLNLKNETAFRAVQYFDLYLAFGKNALLSIKDLQITMTVCLNLACKIEEINCNYLLFLNEKLLESKVTNKEIVDKEVEVLRGLNYRLSTPNLYTFNNIFLQIAIHEIMRLDYNEFIIFNMANINDIVIKNFCPNKEAIFSSPLVAGLICFKATLFSLSYIHGLDITNLYDGVNKQLEQVMDAKFLQKTDLIAYNYFTKLVNDNKIKASSS